MGKAKFDSPWSVANMNALFDDVSAAKGDADSLTEKIGEMDAATAARDGEIAAIDTRVNALEDSQTAQDGQITGLGTRVTALETSQTAQDGQITGIGTRVTALETSQTAQDGQITGIGTRVTALETSQTAQDGQITGLGTRVTALETSQTAQDGQITGLGTRVTALETSQTAQDGQITGLGTRVTALETSQEVQDSALTAISQKIGMKNLFDFEKWKSVPYTARGTVTVGDGTYAITSTANDFYTEFSPSATRPYPEGAELPTTSGKRYAFSWKASGLTSGKTYRVTIYKNGVASSVLADTVNITSASGSLEFTAPSDCNFATFRFNLASAGTSVTFSEIMYRAADTSSAFEEYAPSNRELYEMILAMQGGA